MKSKFWILIVIIISFVFAGCSSSYENDDVVKIGYLGNHLELPLFTAYENGYFEKEGLKVELVKINYEDAEEKIESGNIDAFTCDYKFFKWNEDNINIKLILELQVVQLRL